MMTCLVLEDFFDEGSSLIFVWVADVLCFHEDNQTRQYHYFSTTIACGFTLFLRYVRSRIASQWRRRWKSAANDEMRYMETDDCQLLLLVQNLLSGH